MRSKKVTKSTTVGPKGNLHKDVRMPTECNHHNDIIIDPAVTLLFAVMIMIMSVAVTIACMPRRSLLNVILLLRV